MGKGWKISKATRLSNQARAMRMEGKSEEEIDEMLREERGQPRRQASGAGPGPGAGSQRSPKQVRMNLQDHQALVLLNEHRAVLCICDNEKRAALYRNRLRMLFNQQGIGEHVVVCLKENGVYVWFLPDFNWNRKLTEEMEVRCALHSTPIRPTPSEIQAQLYQDRNQRKVMVQLDEFTYKEAPVENQSVKSRLSADQLRVLNEVRIKNGLAPLSIDGETGVHHVNTTPINESGETPKIDD